MTRLVSLTSDIIFLQTNYIVFLIIFTLLEWIHAHVGYSLQWGESRNGGKRMRKLFPVFSSCIWEKCRENGRGLLPIAQSHQYPGTGDGHPVSSRVPDVEHVSDDALK